MTTRPAVFSGSWYPADKKACKDQIDQFLSKQADLAPSKDQWLGGIVPHAGWYYSGEIACNVINLLRSEAPVDLVVVFGMHLHANSPNYMMAGGAWQTPFGELPVSETLAEALSAQFEFRFETTQHFNPDNTVELQLPFVKYLLDPAEFLALGVPPARASLEIGRAVADWARQNNKRMRVIGSTDLTHYGRNYGFSPKGNGKAALDWVRDENDRAVIEAMLAMDPEGIIDQGLQNQNACCAGAAATTVAAMKAIGAQRAESVAYATSYDKSPGDSFVGYAGMVFGR